MMSSSIKYLAFLAILAVAAKILIPTPKHQYIDLESTRNIASSSINTSNQIDDQILTHKKHLTVNDQIPPALMTEDSKGKDLANRIAALIEKRRKKDKEQQEAEKDSIKKAIEEHKRLSKLKKEYEKLANSLDENNYVNDQTEFDPIAVAFGTTAKTTTIEVNDETSQQSEYISNSSPADETQSVENQMIEIKSWKNKNYFIYGEDTVELFATIKSMGGETLPASIQGQVFTAHNNHIGTITYNLNQSGIYHGAFQPTLKSTDSLGNFHVKLNIKIGNRNVKMIESFSLNTRKATYRNRISYKITEDKNISFKALFRISEPGIYLFQGSLYDANDRLIGISEIPLELGRGNAWVNLDFHGNIFYAKKINGPFTLKNMAIFQVREDLSSHGQEMIQTNLTTEYHGWEEFNSNSATNDLIHGKISDLEAALAL